LEAIAVNRMSCNISDYCANKMTLKMTITAPVIITNPKKSYHYNSASLLSTSESSLSRKTYILPRDSLQLLFVMTLTLNVISAKKARCARLLQTTYYKYNSFILPQASYINRTRLNLLLKSPRQRCCDSDLAKKRNLPSQTDCRDCRSTTAVRRLRPSSSNLSMSCFSIPQDLK